MLKVIVKSTIIAVDSNILVIEVANREGDYVICTSGLSTNLKLAVGSHLSANTCAIYP